jgi:PAS domain S-box-containing protein
MSSAAGMRALVLLLALAIPGVSAGVPADSAEVIRSAAEYDYPPFCFEDADGHASGFSVELFRAAMDAMDVKVEFRTGEWDELRGMLEAGEVDALPLVGRTPEREEAYDFTFPYMSMHGSIVVRRNSRGVEDLEDLRGSRVAVMRGDNAEEFLRREDRGFEIVTTPTFEDALRLLSDGGCDAVVIQRLVALRLIQETGLEDVRVVEGPLEGFRQDFCFAVREGDSETLALLNEGLSIVMADGTFDDLHAKWFAARGLPSRRTMVVGGDRNYPPYEFVDEDGNPAGYNVELTRAVAEAAGLRVEIQLDDWVEIRRGLESGEIDAVHGMFYSPERDAELDFTQPHTVIHHVAVTREGGPDPPESVSELTGLRIAVMEGDISHEFAADKGLESQLETWPTQEQVLEQVALGNADCAIAARIPAAYWIEEHGWENLQVASEPLLSPEYCYAVPQGRQALLAQLSEGLQMVKQSGEYREIYDRWMGVYEDRPPGLVSALRYSAIVLVPLLLVLLGAFLWTRALRRQVAARTAELRRSRKLLESAQSIGRIGGWEWDVDRERLYWTEQTYRIHGMDPSDDPGTTELMDLSISCYGEGQRKELTEAFARCVEAGVPYEIESRFQSRDGRDLWVRTAGRAVKESGRVVSVYGYIQDITRWHEVEGALRQSERKYRLVAENTLDVIWTMTPDLVFTYVNPAIERLSGYTPEEWTGTSLSDHCDEENLELMRSIVEKEIAKGPDHDGVIFEAEMLRRDGTPVSVEIHGTVVFDEEWNPVLLQGTTRDITVRKEMERERMVLQQQLLQAQKLESIGRLAGGVAHDFNNMLQTILGNAEMADAQRGNPEEVRDRLAEIRRAAEHSSKLTGQLLAFARRQAASPRILSLNDVLKGMLKMLQRLIGEDIDLMWAPAGELWTVEIDPTQVEQVLVNLCVNARDAIDGNGKITIETANRTFGDEYCERNPEFSPGEYVMLAVSDDGCGMDRVTMGSVFEPFFTTKEQGRGTGLGLATVYGIVKQNSGFINVYSEPGEGTSFRIYFPRRSGEEASDAPGRRKDARGSEARGETILLVEDEESILEVGRSILERLGYLVMAARTPEEALELAKEHRDIQLLVTDVVLPQMNGRDLADRLRRSRPEMRVLFMSGYTADVIVHQGILEEGVEFVQKPFSIEQLALSVRRALE